MALGKISYFLIFLIVNLRDFYVQAQLSKCDVPTTFLATYQSSTIKWPDTAKSTCTYLFKSPANTIMYATIYHNLTGSEPSCSQNQYIIVSRDNMQYWDGYSLLCGYRSASNAITIKSIGNELKIGIYSADYKRSVNIQVTVYPLSQSNCDCGWNVNKKIIDGVNAQKNEFVGHAVLMTRSSTGYEEAFCGGIIVSQTKILTAAHCVQYLYNVAGISKSYVLAGRHNIALSPSSDSPYAETYGISSGEAHGSYNSQTGLNDIGIITTQTYIRFTRGVGPACLPFLYQNQPVYDNTLLTTVGHGATEYVINSQYDDKSKTLQKVSLYVKSSLASDCKNAGILCAQGVQQGYTRGDSCTRDSGGGAYAYIVDRYFTFGIISRGVDCGSVNSFSYNTRVSAYLDWIQAKVGFVCVIRYQ